jgi:hypothetical protein
MWPITKKQVCFTSFKIIFVIYIIKELVQPKMSLNREFLIWKERGRGEVGRGRG